MIIFLFTKQDNKGIVICLIYVDDILISGNSYLKHILKQNFKIKDLGDLKFFFWNGSC